MTLRDQGAGTASVIDIILPSERLYQSNKQQEDLKRFEKKVQEKFQKSANINGDDSKKPDNKEGGTETNQIPDEKIEEKGQEILEDKSSHSSDVFNEIESEEEGVGYDIASRSTFFALENLKKKGMLDNNKVQDYSGRSKDTKFHKEMERLGVDNAEDRVKLEYRDKTGKLMTQKEAFRYMCHIFHGKKPSKRKLAKAAKKASDNQKSQWRDPTEAASYKMMKVATQISSNPYVDLTYKKKD